MGTIKHIWNEQEDKALIDSMIDLKNLSTHNADNGFRNGYLKILEVKLAEKIPDCGLKARPHIKSRLKTLKSDWATVYDMVYGNNTSGFGWDPINQSVIAENDVWEAYIKAHPDAKGFKNKKLNHFYALCTIYGKDRAIGNEAIPPADYLEEDTEINDETEILHDCYSPFMDRLMNDIELNQSTPGAASNNHGTTSGNQSTASSPPSKKKMKSRADGIDQAIREAAITLGDKIEQAGKDLSRAELLYVENRKIFLNELAGLEGLTMTETFRAGIKLSADGASLAMYNFIPYEHRAAFVKEYLRITQG